LLLRGRFLPQDANATEEEEDSNNDDEKDQGSDSEDESGQEKEEEEGEEVVGEGEVERRRIEKKKKDLKRRFDAEYDDAWDEEEKQDLFEQAKEEMSKQAALNLHEFEEDDPELRAAVQGHMPGTYVRVLLKSIPCEFITHFNPVYPIVLGGLLPSEESFGFVQVGYFHFKGEYLVNKILYIYIYRSGLSVIAGIPRFSRPMIH
jgi:ribosome biogenesis protein BMS1